MKPQISLLFHILNRGFLLIVFSCYLIGCASFPGKNIPNHTYADLPPAPENKPCLVIADNLPKTSREEIIDLADMLEKSGYFLKAPEHCMLEDGTKSKNSMKVDFKNDSKMGDMAVAVVSGFISGATFLVFPGFAHDEFVMKVQLKNGAFDKEYVYREHMNTWFHLSMIFMMPGRTPSISVRSIYDKMIMNFLYDYSFDVHKGRLAAASQ